MNSYTFRRGATIISLSFDPIYECIHMVRTMLDDCDICTSTPLREFDLGYYPEAATFIRRCRADVNRSKNVGIMQADRHDINHNPDAFFKFANLKRKATRVYNDYKHTLALA